MFLDVAQSEKGNLKKPYETLRNLKQPKTNSSRVFQFSLLPVLRSLGEGGCLLYSVIVFDLSSIALDTSRFNMI